MRSMLLALLLCAAAPVALAAEPPSGGASHGDEDGDEHGHDEHAEGGHGKPWGAIITNTAIAVGVLAWFGGPWMVAFFRRRKSEIEQELTAAQRAREAAEAKLAEMDQKLRAVETEVDGILANASQRAEHERQRILATAGADAERLVAQAETQVNEIKVGAERGLKQLAADLSVDLARESITKQLNAEDRQKLFDDYVEGLRQSVR